MRNHFGGQDFFTEKAVNISGFDSILWHCIFVRQRMPRGPARTESASRYSNVCIESVSDERYSV